MVVIDPRESNTFSVSLSFISAKDLAVHSLVSLCAVVVTALVASKERKVRAAIALISATREILALVDTLLPGWHGE